MLVLSRKKGESIVVRDDIVVTVIELRGGRVRLGVEAPDEVTVHRKELYDKIVREKAHRPDQCRTST
jgi:carbon storage regulator